ncbi:MAG: hypothetical protein EZS28_010288 [Streblomastix strix]|uniref:Uncharacterized protein n=1 Tax=Streblomastix strix TaxID=222440 RepID=A0A5J4WHX7_9EUKA|nr:MAG: hypothetical protein EZS28_010288 [Streblomastix strix]
MSSLKTLNRKSGIDLNELEKEARQEFETEKCQGAGGAGGQCLMEVDGMEDNYDYYESQVTGQDRMKSRAKPFGRLPFHLSMIQRTRKHGGPQFREEAGDVLATLVGYLNGDIKKINSVLGQDLDDNQAIPDNVIVFDKKKNAIYSVDDYTTAVGFGDPEHQHKRNWKKKYYSDVNDLERAALVAKLKQQGIKGGPYMKWLSITKPLKAREIKNYSFRAFVVSDKKIIDQNGGAQLPMAIKQQIMASAWNSVLIIPAVEILERYDEKIDIYNRNNKVHVQKGDYEYLLLAKDYIRKNCLQLLLNYIKPTMSMPGLRKLLDKLCNIMVIFQQKDNKTSTNGMLAAVFDENNQSYDSQRRLTHPIVPPITPQIQALPELQPLNQSTRQTQPINVLQNMIMLCTPQLEEEYERRINFERKYIYNQHVKYDPFYVHTISPTKEYYKNDLKTIEDVDAYLDETFQQEQKFAFKTVFDFGMIIERVDGKENEQQITYKINRPLEARTEMKAPTTIRTHLDLAEYKRFIRNHIIQM